MKNIFSKIIHGVLDVLIFFVDLALIAFSIGQLKRFYKD